MVDKTVAGRIVVLVVVAFAAVYFEIVVAVVVTIEFVFVVELSTVVAAVDCVGRINVAYPIVYRVD